MSTPHPVEVRYAMLRLHFTPADLARVRIADRPFAQFEVVGAARRLQGTEAGVLFDGWRRRVHTSDASGARGRPVLPRLFDLVPRSGRIAAFLTPVQSPHDSRRWLEGIRATSPQQLRAGLQRYAQLRHRPLRGWLRELADGGRAALPELESTLQAFAQVAIEPMWSLAVASVEAERARRARDLLDGGLDRLLASLPGVLGWRPPVLITACADDHDIYLAGRGLVLVPSYFCWSSVILVERPSMESLMLVYPVQHRVLPETVSRASRPLVAVLGRTRTAVLELIAEEAAAGSGAGSTTGELARRLGVAPATVSWHLAALREAGLVSTQRNRRAFHSLTPAGRYLVDQRAGSGIQSSSNRWTAAP